MATADEIAVEVAWALPQRQQLIPLRVPVGTTAEQAVRMSGILEQFPEIDLARNRLGIFGRVCPPERLLAAGDRVEIYRPLLADPKEVRRRLAAEGRSMGKGAAKDQDPSGS